MPYYPVAEISQLGSGQLDSEVPLAGTMPRGLGEGRSRLYAGGVERPLYTNAKGASAGVCAGALHGHSSTVAVACQPLQKSGDRFPALEEILAIFPLKRHVCLLMPAKYCFLPAYANV